MSWALKIVALVTMTLIAGAPRALAQVGGPYIDAPGAFINIDGTTGCGSPITRTINVPDSFIIGDLDLGFIATHAWRSDIRIDLQSPQSTTVSVLTGPQNSALDDYNIQLNDESATPINTAPHNTNDNVAAAPYENDVQPNNALSAFDGENAQGNWTLSICDTFTGGDNGQYRRAELLFTAAFSGADLSLNLNASTASPSTGSNVFFDVTVQNAGNNPATGVVVDFALPSGLSYVSDNSSGAYASGSGLWTIPSPIPVNGSVTLRVIAMVLPTGAYTALAEVTASNEADPDSTPGNAATQPGEDDTDTAPLTPTPPPAPLFCLGRPITPLVFENPVLESGADLQVGAIYRFVSVAPGVDALVEITSFNGGGSLLNIDNPIDGLPDNFQPTLLGPAGDTSVDFEITIVATGTTTPGILDFAGSAIDVDGNGAGGGLREYIEVSDNIVEYALNNPTELAVNASGPSAGDRLRFESSTDTNAPGIDPNSPENIATAFFTDVAIFEYRIGKFGSAAGGAGRLNSLAFNCPNLTTPVPNPSADEDFGDAPLNNYGNPIHVVDPAIRLGATNTAETTPYDDPTAAGDAGDDGVTIPILSSGSAASVPVTVVGAGGFLQAWFDWNGDGDFNDSGEQIATDVQDTDNDGTISLSVTPPTTASAGTTFARFRWSTAAGLTSIEAAADGEVEDYQVMITVVLIPVKTISVISTNGVDEATCAAAADPGTNNQYALPGACVQYQISVAHPGGGIAATDIELADILPDDLTYAGASQSVFTGGTLRTTDTAATPNTITCTPTTTDCVVRLENASLASGATGILTIRALVE